MTHRQSLPREAEKTFRRAHISKKDFMRAGEFIVAARRNKVATIEHESLLLSAVIHYARPFTPNERPPKGVEPPSDPRLNLELAEFEDADDRALHDLILLVRNKAVAHAEFEHYPVRLVAERQGFDTAIAAMVFSSFDIRHLGLDLFRFQRIAREMQARCQFVIHAFFATR